MFQRWSYTHIFLAAAMAICASLMIGYAFPGLAALSLVTRLCLFALAGVGALFLGCMGIYASWRRGY